MSWVTRYSSGIACSLAGTFPRPRQIQKETRARSRSQVREQKGNQKAGYHPPTPSPELCSLCPEASPRPDRRWPLDPTLSAPRSSTRAFLGPTDKLKQTHGQQTSKLVALRRVPDWRGIFAMGSYVDGRLEDVEEAKQPCFGALLRDWVELFKTSRARHDALGRTLTSFLLFFSVLLFSPFSSPVSDPPALQDSQTCCFPPQSTEHRQNVDHHNHHHPRAFVEEHWCLHQPRTRPVGGRDITQ